MQRDLKPQNLLLSGHGPNAVLKIADFGFARDLQPQVGPSGCVNINLAACAFCKLENNIQRRIGAACHCMSPHLTIERQRAAPAILHPLCCLVPL